MTFLFNDISTLCSLVRLLCFLYMAQLAHASLVKGTYVNGIIVLYGVWRGRKLGLIRRNEEKKRNC